ncbi:MAG: hypothetical protein ACNA8W_17330 [Bradymonadaceae bacterium]
MNTPTPPAAGEKGLRAALGKLSAREQKLVMAMLGVFVILSLAVVIGLFQRSLHELEEDTQNLQLALSTLSLAGPAYVARTTDSGEVDPRVARFSDEILSNNDLKLTSFVATHAAATNINVNSYDEDQIPLGSKTKGGKADDGPVIVERQVRVDIREAQMDNLLKLLERIENSPEPVIVKRLDVRAQRGREGQVRAMFIVSTYIRRDKES